MSWKTHLQYWNKKDCLEAVEWLKGAIEGMPNQHLQIRVVEGVQWVWIDVSNMVGELRTKWVIETRFP